MADFSHTQDDFRGGEWSASAQGKITDPRYKTAMNVCLNGCPVEEGAWERRPGFMTLGTSYKGQTGIIRPFWLTDNVAIIVEITDNAHATLAIDPTFATPSQLTMRFWAPTQDTSWNLLPDNYAKVTAIDTGSPATLTISGAPSPAWATDDQIYFVRDTASAASNAPTINGVQFRIVKLSNTTYQLYNSITGLPIDGSALNFTAGVGTFDWAAHIKIFQLKQAGYTTSSTYVNVVQQSHSLAWVFMTGVVPYLLKAGAAITTGYKTIPISFSCVDALFTSVASNYYDGPYNDPPVGTSQTGNDTATLDSMTTITPVITLSGAGAVTFATTDVGRQIRLWSQPQAWLASTSYDIGDTVTYQGGFYTLSLAAASGTIPGQTIITTGVPVLPWTPTPQAGIWRYGTITARTNSLVATLLINADFSGVAENGLTLDTYQLGFFTDTNQVYPTNAVVHQGRVWMTGAVEGRFDASASNAFTYVAPGNQATATDGIAGISTPLFSPTDEHGTVGDANGFSYTLNSPRTSQILWGIPEHDGIIFGSTKGEWLITSSAGAITPTNIEAAQTSSFGAGSPAQPVRIGPCIVYVQALGIQVIELLADVFKAGKYTGRHINADAKHLTNVYGQAPFGIKELAYQEEVAPVIWAVTWDGKLRGCTYRRNGTFASSPPDLYAWHQHTHGAGRLFWSMCTGAAGPVVPTTQETPPAGNRETLVVLTQDTSLDTTCYVEVLADLFRETDPLTLSYHVDGQFPLHVVQGTDSPNAVVGCSAFGGGSHNGADVLLTGNNLIAQGGNVGAAEIAQSCPVVPGYFYFEVLFVSGTGADSDGVGISTTTATASNIDTLWTNGYGFSTLGSATVFNGSNSDAQRGTPGSGSAGDYYAVALDTVHGRALISRNPTAGDDISPGGNPPIETAVGSSWGTDISAKFNNVNACLTALFKANTADQFSINNGPSFRFLKPMGLSAGWNGRDYNAYGGFDAASAVKAINQGVGNDFYGFKIDTSGGLGVGGARSKHGISAAGSKIYIEWMVSQRGGNEYWGICDTTYVLGAAPGTHFKALNCPYSNTHGELCLDFDAAKMWIRGQHSDGWTGGGDPALGTGGTSLSTLTAVYYFAGITTVNSATVFITITDPKGMKNAPPSGFSAGWPTV